MNGVSDPLSEIRIQFNTASLVDLFSGQVADERGLQTRGRVFLSTCQFRGRVKATTSARDTMGHAGFMSKFFLRLWHHSFDGIFWSSIGSCAWRLQTWALMALGAGGCSHWPCRAVFATFAHAGRKMCWRFRIPSAQHRLCWVVWHFAMYSIRIFSGKVGFVVRILPVVSFPAPVWSV